MKKRSGMTEKHPAFRFKVEDMRAIDEVTGTVELDIIVYLRWMDPSLVNISK